MKKLCTHLACIALLTACGIVAACDDENSRQGLILKSTNRAPVADAGADQNANLYGGAAGSAGLDGSASYDPDGDALTYLWEVVHQPAGSTASCADPAAAVTTLTFDAEGTYEVRLTVNDGSRTIADLATVYVSENNGPAADAGTDQEVSINATITLDGSGSSDPENDPLACTWTQIHGPRIGTGTLTGVSPSFTAPSEVCTIAYDLQVDDGSGNSLPDRVYIFVMEEAGAGIYVAVSGDDANDGTDRAAPKKTIQAAVTAALASGSDVYVSGGDYAESVSLASGVSMYGGFLHGTWERDTASYQVKIQGGTIALDGSGVGDCIIDGFSIASSNAANYGGGSYGVRLINSTVTLRDCRITAGNGAPGHDGSTGSEGAPGGNGSTGGSGIADIGPLADANVYGGDGGTSAAGRNGGNGGFGGWCLLGDSMDGGDGSPGINGTPGGAGGLTINPGTDGFHGSNGTDGSPGSNGSGGSSGAITGNLWISSIGANGGKGNPGNGGGGGGGGGGQFWAAEFYYLAGEGNGGGGGGGGGSGGNGGICGGGGGASFGVLLIESTVTVAKCIIISGNGGSGGNGGNGGNGGSGGNAGNGGDNATDEVGAGGNGGNGGKGGAGGPGGGGAGGPSFAIYKHGWSSGAILSATQLAHGAGGAGGLSNGVLTGSSGDTGFLGGAL